MWYAASGETETARLHSVIVQVQQFEQQKAQLQQRVTLIEQLRKDQIGPVHMLDQISRALPTILLRSALVWRSCDASSNGNSQARKS